MSFDYYTSILQHFLQSTVVIKCEHKTLRRGKITLFNTKQYFIKIHIELENKDLKILELPYPYSMEYNKATNSCVLDYRLSAMCSNILPVMMMLKKCSTSTAHKTYNNTVTITSIN